MTRADGTEMVVRARPKRDADVASELTWFLPWPIYVAGQIVRELRQREKHEGRWLVTVSQRRGFKEPLVVGEFPKAEALDIVDARAHDISRNDSR